MEDTNNEVKPKRYWFKLCLFLTIIYPFIIFFILFMNLYYSPPSPKLGLNEIGDFLAGAFSPLAFSWLVYGYLMQNNELTLARKDYQSSLEISKQSLEHQNKQYEDLKIKEHNEKQPIFRTERSDKVKYFDEEVCVDSFIDFDIKVKNHGGSIFNFYIESQVKKEKEIQVDIPTDIIKNNSEIEIKFIVQESIFKTNFSKHCLYYSFNDLHGIIYKSRIHLNFSKIRFNKTYNLRINFDSTLKTNTSYFSKEL